VYQHGLGNLKGSGEILYGGMISDLLSGVLQTHQALLEKTQSCYLGGCKKYGIKVVPNVLEKTIHFIMRFPPFVSVLLQRTVTFLYFFQNKRSKELIMQIYFRRPLFIFSKMRVILTRTLCVCILIVVSQLQYGLHVSRECVLKHICQFLCLLCFFKS